MGQLTTSQILLEWSADPLSDTTPTYTTISNLDIIDLDYGVGVDREGDDPEPGWLTVVLRNRDRRYEPLFGTNTIDQGQRLRLTVASVQKGIFYIQDFALAFPTGETYSEITLTCGDGVDVLGNLPGLDPPDAQTVPDVFNFDEPWGYWRLGEEAGTKIVAQTRKVKRGKGKTRRKIKVRRTVTAAELTGTTGTSGDYINLPTLGQPSLIVGDADTSVTFGEKGSGSTSYGRVPVEDHHFHEVNAVSMSCLVRRTAIFGTDRVFLAGPFSTAASQNIFQLEIEATTHEVTFTVELTGGPITCTSTSVVSSAAGLGTHVGASWDGNVASLYINGVLEAEATGPGTIRLCDANEFLYIGTQTPLVSSFVNLDEAAVYEKALTAERFLAHYQATRERGWGQETAGERIAAIVESDLWAETEVQTSGRDVIPQMMHGQSRLEEIAETMHAEGPRTLFWFNGNGDPAYLGHEFQATDAVYNTVQATFGDTVGAIVVDELAIEYDSEVFNIVTASREGGPLVEVEDTTSTGLRRDRENSDYTDLLLVEDVHVESLADHVLDLYSAPMWRPLSLTVNASKALTQMKTLDLGYLVRVKKQGVTGAALDVIAHIIGRREHIDRERNYTVTYSLGRGLDATDGLWHAGIVGFSEAGATTVAA